MNYIEPQHVARIIAASILIATWFVRRQEKELLHMAAGYAALSFGAIACRLSIDAPEALWLQVATLGPSTYAAFVWMAVGELQSRSPRGRDAIVVASIVESIFLAVDAFQPRWLSGMVSIVVCPATAWLGIVLWRCASRSYRSVAVMVLLQSVILLSHGVVPSENQAIRYLLALTYAVAAASLAYVLLKELTVRVERYALIDELTNLPNRKSLTERLTSALIHRGNSVSTGVILVDIEGIERIRKVLGHPEGDRILQHVAMILSGLSGPEVLLARYSSTEFVYFVQVDAIGGTQEMEALAERIILKMRRPVGIGGMNFQLGVRVGIQPATEVFSAEETLTRASSAASDCATSESWHYYDPELHARVARQLSIERHLCDALAEGELYLVYQPIVCAATRSLVKVEALLRWNSPKLGAVPPAEFVPIAESSDLILSIGQWVLEEACEQAARWYRANNSGVIVSVNVAASQIQRGDFVQAVGRLLEDKRLPPSFLELELTEGIMPVYAPVAERNFGLLRELGIRVALDDFGTGHSSLARLARLELDTLKIDRLFVKDIGEDERSRSLCEVACAIGRRLNLQIVAEGVETETQAKLLTEFGVHYLQGYLLGRPQTADSISCLLGRLPPSEQSTKRPISTDCTWLCHMSAATRSPTLR